MRRILIAWRRRSTLIALQGGRSLEPAGRPGPLRPCRASGPRSEPTGALPAIPSQYPYCDVPIEDVLKPTGALPALVGSRRHRNRIAICPPSLGEAARNMAPGAGFGSAAAAPPRPSRRGVARRRTPQPFPPTTAHPPTPHHPPPPGDCPTPQPLVHAGEIHAGSCVSVCVCVCVCVRARARHKHTARPCRRDRP